MTVSAQPMAPTPAQSSDAIVEDASTASAPQSFSLWQRMQLAAISWTAYFVIRLLCSTLKFTYAWEDPAEKETAGRVIHPFWHRSIIPAIYHFRNRGIAVMTSSSFDGEYIARIIEKFGFRAVRGSSTRGGVRALRALHRELEAGHRVAFTIDGPTGPRYVAKPGPVVLARNTQAPIQCFYIAVDRAWILNSWDALIIPKPFAHAHVQVARIIIVPKSSSPSELEAHHAAMQAALERVRDAAEAEVKRKGT